MTRTEDSRRHWVLIESGSNQEFILQSTRRRFQVAASALVKDLATWVRTAITQSTAGNPAAIEVVVCTSSKALLLVDAPGTGRSVVARVTEAVLRKAPGMDVWGYVDEVAVGPGAEMGRLQEVHRQHAALRWVRPTPRQRFPQRPFLETCSVTEMPATDRITDPARPGEQVLTSASALTARVYERARGAITELRNTYGDAVQADLGKELPNAGWVAVVHADGNGIGDVITKIRDLTTYKAFSTSLEEATSAAFAAAVKSVGKKNWLVPLIVGGDDVTFLCSGQVALDVTRTYLTEFERATKGIATDLAELGVDVPDRLTACAGVAFVKPNFPFHAAHELAEELCRSAKKATKEHARSRSSYDFHVLHDSVLRPLSNIRGELLVKHKGLDLDLWAGPFLAPAPDDAVTTGDWTAQHEDELLRQAVEMVREAEKDRMLSGSSMSRLRDALLRGGPAIDTARQRVLVGASKEVREFAGEHLTVPGSSPVFSRFMAIHDAADVAAGVSSGPRATPSNAEEAEHA